MKPEELATCIDHTFLAATATEARIVQLCQEAMRYGFKSVSVNGNWTRLCADLLSESNVVVSTVIGFPLGAMSQKVKILEAVRALDDGAKELDMVLNIGWLKEGRFDKIKDEVTAIKECCLDRTLKVIIETCLLSEEEKAACCSTILESGADFVNTSTGFSTGGASEKDVATLKSLLNGNVKVKASGGIRSYDTAMAMLASGADRLGTSSGIAIIQGAEAHAAY